MPPRRPETIDLARLQRAAGPFPLEAFEFVQQGLTLTSVQVHANELGGGGHVTGGQLSLGLAEFAIQQYGLLARSVLESWGIHRTDEFGRIVFGLIECGLMSKSPQDSPDDFKAVYDFGEMFHSAQVAQRITLNA